MHYNLWSSIFQFFWKFGSLRIALSIFVVNLHVTSRTCYDNNRLTIVKIKCSTQTFSYHPNNFRNKFVNYACVHHSKNFFSKIVNLLAEHWVLNLEPFTSKLYLAEFSLIAISYFSTCCTLLRFSLVILTTKLTEQFTYWLNGPSQMITIRSVMMVTWMP